MGLAVFIQTALFTWSPLAHMRFLQHRECASHKAVTYHRYKYTSRFIRDIRAASGKQGMACTATVATTMGCIERSLGASLPHRVLHTLFFTTAVEIVKWKGWAFLQKASVTVLLLYYNISRAGREGRFHVGGGHHSPANGGEVYGRGSSADKINNE